MNNSGKPLPALNVAVVGLGSIGRRHLENLGRLGIGRRLVVRRSRGANPAMQPPPDAVVVHGVQAALAERPDAAIICNPTSLHVETALAFLEAGVAVLVEKPLSHCPSEAARLLQAASRHRAKAGMAYCMRYHPAYAQAREALRAGRIGRVLYAKTWFESFLPDWHPWEDYRQSYAARRVLGGGVLPTVDHEIDFLNWCLGSPQHVGGTAIRTGALETDAEDLAMLSMVYRGAITAGLVLSLCRRDRSRGFEFIGSQGSLRFRLESPQLELVSAPDQPYQILWDGTGYDLNEAYVNMLADFLQNVAAGQPPPVPLEAGQAALRVACEVRGGEVGCDQHALASAGPPC